MANILDFSNYLSYLQAIDKLISQLEDYLPDMGEAAKDCRDLTHSATANPVNPIDRFRDFSVLHRLSDKQQILVAAALVSYTHPAFYFKLILHLQASRTNCLGLHNDNGTGLVYPTVQTLLLLLFGTDYNNAMAGMSDLLHDPLFKLGILETTPLQGNLIKNNSLNHVVSVSDDYLAYFFCGTTGSPKFSASFPAQKITTKLGWNDLVLDEVTLQQIKEITAWHKYRDVVLNEWNLHKMLSPGYKVLFYGPPGTGKTLTAAIMGQELGIDVFRIDLSMVVSKYIGETEKNLSTLFDRAMNKNWILFFDEADALFGTRTEVRDSHDRYANQEVSYLLQRLENYNGVIILASNMKGNIDKAFSRRFQNMIRFQIPDAEQRKLLWANSFSPATVLENNFSVADLAKTYEITGGSIVNVVQYASLKAAERSSNVILFNDIKTGIIRELSKEGKTP